MPYIREHASDRDQPPDVLPLLANVAQDDALVEGEEEVQGGDLDEEGRLVGRRTGGRVRVVGRRDDAEVVAALEGGETDAVDGEEGFEVEEVETVEEGYGFGGFCWRWGRSSSSSSSLSTAALASGYLHRCRLHDLVRSSSVYSFPFIFFWSKGESWVEILIRD